MLKALIHFILKQYSKKRHRSFLKSRSQLSWVQDNQLKKILQTLSTTEVYGTRLKTGDLSYAFFEKHFSPTTYHDYESAIQQQRETKRAIISPLPERYQPTSGSTSLRKWIPYTREFLGEIDQASLVWLHDLYLHYPGIRLGSHYWSLSWLPNELREKTNNDDLEYLDRMTKSLLSRVMATPREIQNAPTSESSLFATLCYLVSAKDLSFIFVWSPTFFLSLLNEIQLHRTDIVKTLRQGVWSQYAQELQDIKAPYSQEQAHLLSEISFSQGWPHRLWPGLSLLSAWSSADSSRWIEKIQEVCPSLKIQGKGLFATEAVVTIPVEGELHLSYMSHFYEFLLPDETIKRAHELKVGERVRPLVTASNGLVRYDLGDEMRVTGFKEGCPLLEFLGRRGTLDFVGEKLSFESLKQIVQELRLSHSLKALGFVAGIDKKSGLPHYRLVIEGEASEESIDFLESKLLEHHHYALARELNQLGCAQIIYTKCGISYLEKMISLYGWNKGDVKWETALKVPYLEEVEL